MDANQLAPLCRDIRRQITNLGGKNESCDTQSLMAEGKDVPLTTEIPSPLNLIKCNRGFPEDLTPPRRMASPTDRQHWASLQPVAQMLKKTVHPWSLPDLNAEHGSRQGRGEKAADSRYLQASLSVSKSRRRTLFPDLPPPATRPPRGTCGHPLSRRGFQPLESAGRKCSQLCGLNELLDIFFLKKKKERREGEGEKRRSSEWSVISLGLLEALQSYHLTQTPSACLICLFFIKQIR